VSIFALTSLAKADIFGIWSYIADDNDNAANRVEQAIYEACEFVAKDSHRYRNYTIVYRPDTTPLQIVAVLHGKRNIRPILKQRQ